jgi:site-specific recombinase XerC
MTTAPTPRATLRAAIRDGRGIGVPSLIAAAGDDAAARFQEFFSSNTRNRHTRRAYYQAADDFLRWCAAAGIPSIINVQPVHVKAWTEASARKLKASSVKQRLSALRNLFDWLVNSEVISVNPAHRVTPWSGRWSGEPLDGPSLTAQSPARRR